MKYYSIWPDRIETTICRCFGSRLRFLFRAELSGLKRKWRKWTVKKTRWYRRQTQWLASYICRLFIGLNLSWWSIIVFSNIIFQNICFFSDVICLINGESTDHGGLKAYGRYMQISFLKFYTTPTRWAPDPVIKNIIIIYKPHKWPKIIGIIVVISPRNEWSYFTYISGRVPPTLQTPHAFTFQVPPLRRRGAAERREEHRRLVVQKIIMGVWGYYIPTHQRKSGWWFHVL